MLNLDRVNFKEFAGTLHALFGSTDHRNELTVASADIATRNGSIDRMDVTLSCHSKDFFRKRRAARRVVDQSRSCLHVLQDANTLVEDHSADVFRIAKHQEEDVSLPRDVMRLHELSTSGHQLVCLGGGPVEDH